MIEHPRDVFSKRHLNYEYNTLGQKDGRGDPSFPPASKVLCNVSIKVKNKKSEDPFSPPASNVLSM